MKHQLTNQIVVSLVIIFSLAWFSGCMDGQSSDNSAALNTEQFSQDVTDYGNHLTAMKSELEEHGDWSDWHSMWDMMAAMHAYRDAMEEHMTQLQIDLDDMIAWCAEHGFHGDYDWEDIMNIHDQCWSEIGGHYNDMEDMMDDMMGHWGDDDWNEEMHDHMDAMWTYWNEMESFHQTIMSWS